MPVAFDNDLLFERYREMQDYLGWTEADARRIPPIAAIVAPALPDLVEDFYREIQRHEGARRVITGGLDQIERLKQTLAGWLDQLFSGKYDSDYIIYRWKVGYRHVEIDLDQIYVASAFSRIRSSLTGALIDGWDGSHEQLWATVISLQKLLDLDEALMTDAYQAEFSERLSRSERAGMLGEVAAGIARELRVPLNALRTSVYFLLNAPDGSPEKRYEHLARIDRQVSAVDEVITILSDFAKLPVPQLRPVRIEALLKRLLEDLDCTERDEILVEFSKDLSQVLADPDQLSLALNNLISVAIQTLPSGERLSIRGQQRSEFIDLEIGALEPKSLTDSQGEAIESVFGSKGVEPGLGLAIAHAILEKHHGQLCVRSRASQGASITIRLPCVM